MKKISVKLILFISIVLIGSFAAIYLLYSTITVSKIRSRAEYVLNYMLGNISDEEYDDNASSYGYSYILTDQSYNPSVNQNLDMFLQEDGYYPDDEVYYDNESVFDWDMSEDADPEPEEVYPSGDTILSWYQENDVSDDTIYYIDNDSQQIYTARVTMENEYCILNVNVTSEMELLKNFQLVFWIVIAACVVVASLVGMMLGRRLERGQLKQKQFFENASHDLKTPLMAIQGYAEGLDSGVITDTGHAYHVILEESERMADLVDEIMMLSRLESGRVRLNRTSVSLSDLVEDCLMGIEYQAGEKHTEIHINLPDMTISADKMQMERAVTNLLSNAIRHAQTEISIFYENSQLMIWNDCEMLSPEELKAVFERFHTGKNGSTGIGLALTKEIIERHGWKISAENGSSRGKNGVCFKIIF